MLSPRAAVFLLALAFASCARDAVGPANQLPPAPNDKPDSTATSPTFLTAASGAPGIANPVVRFYARNDQTREVQMYYRALPGQKDSTVFIDLKVPDRSLYKRPDGTLIGPTDSVLITLTLTDSTHLITDFEPAGLQFSADRPPRLKLSFQETNPDVNGDGVVNQTDQTLTVQFHVWRRESSTSPWQALTTTVEVGLHEVEADIFGFTSYAIGY